MSLYNGVTVKRHPLWGYASAPQFNVWLLECDYCEDSMEFATWADAQAGADKHARRHADEACPHCKSVPWIKYSEWP